MGSAKYCSSALTCIVFYSTSSATSVLLDELDHFLRRDFSVYTHFLKDGLHLVHGEAVRGTNVDEDALEARQSNVIFTSSADNVLLEASGHLLRVTVSIERARRETLRCHALCLTRLHKYTYSATRREGPHLLRLTVVFKDFLQLVHSLTRLGGESTGRGCQEALCGGSDLECGSK
jgi:hypothetical protein